MAKSILIVAATGSADPVVGASADARNSMAEIHTTLQQTVIAAGLRVHTLASGEDLFSAALQNLLRSGLLPLAGVWFDNALGFEVELFVEAWRQAYPYLALPELYGLVHSTNRGGYAHKSQLEWDLLSRTRAASNFSGLYALSRTVLKRLPQTRADRLPEAFAPYYRLGLADGSEPALNRNAFYDPVYPVNWIYGFSSVDRYDCYVLLCNLLEQHLLAEQKANPQPDSERPLYFHPHLYSDAWPEKLLLPRSLKAAPDEGHRGERYPYPVALDREHLPQSSSSVTVSFRVNAEYDYTLLKLAELGYMVLAPNSGIYREALDPACLYEPALLDHFTVDLPEAHTLKVAIDLYQKILGLRRVWLTRAENRNKINGVMVGLLRRSVRRQVEHGATNLVDRVMESLGYAA